MNGPGSAGVSPAPYDGGPEASAPRNSFARSLGLAAALVVAAFIAYSPALQGEFLLDDDEHVTRPEFRTLAGLARIWTEPGATQQYYPIVHTAFWLEHRLWGDAVLGYHVVNVALHAIAALLVVALTSRLRLPGAWLAGFVFALHPVGVESVAWISEQKNTLSTVLALGATCVYLRFDERKETQSYVVATVLFVLALLSKTATAMLPLVLPVVGWWRRGRMEWRRDLVPMLPWCCAAVAAGMITIAVEGGLIRGIQANLSLTWLERCAIAAQAIWFYGAKLIWPANLSFFYERWPTLAETPWRVGFLVATLGLCATMLWIGRRSRGPLAAVLIFVGLLLPVLGFVDVQWFVFSYVADHFQYLASIVVIVALSATYSRLDARSEGAAPSAPVERRGGDGARPSETFGLLTMAGSVVLVATLGILTWRHSGTFRDNVTLYANAIARTPGSAVAHNHLGLALAKLPGRLPEAIASYEAALKINPDAAEVHENLGAALLATPGHATDAVAHLETALHLKPSLASARRALAGAYFDFAKASGATPGRPDDTIGLYQRAIRADPKFAEAHFNLGNALLRDPARRDEAIACFEAAVRLKPDFAEAHTNLGTAIAGIPGRLAEAAAHFEAALRANPDYAPARNNLRTVQRLRNETKAARE